MNSGGNETRRRVVPAWALALTIAGTGFGFSCGPLKPRCGVDSGLSTPGNGEFSAVSSGVNGSCAIAIHGELACWGTTRTIRNGRFAQVDVGEEHVCAVTQGGSLLCWGSPLGNRRADLPPGKFAEVSVAAEYACARTDKGAVLCWSRSVDPEVVSLPFPAAQISTFELTKSSFSGVDALLGGSGVLTEHVLGLCVVGARGEAACLRPHVEASGFEPVPGKRLTKIAVGGAVGCAIDDLGALHCWYNKNHDPVHLPSLPKGGMRDVDVYGVPKGYLWRVCVVTEAGEPRCWLGLEDDPVRSEDCLSPQGSFVQISAGLGQVCGLRDDGRIACWGSDYYGESTPP